jgi:hypothetical protein
MTSGLNGMASYRYGHASRGKSGTAFSFGAIASVQEFSGGSSKPFWTPNYAVNTGFGTKLTPKISYSANVGLSYAPYYQYAPFLTIPIPGSTVTAVTAVTNESPTPDAGAGAEVPVTLVNQPPLNLSPVGSDGGFAVQSTMVSHLSSGMSITDRFTKRSSVSLNTGLEEAQVEEGRVETWSTNLRLSHNLTRKVAIYFGYGLQESRNIQDSLPETKSENHTIDFGIDYGEGGSITFARYYTFSFTTGLSAVQQSDGVQAGRQRNAGAPNRPDVGRVDRRPAGHVVHARIRPAALYRLGERRSGWANQATVEFLGWRRIPGWPAGLLRFGGIAGQ